MEPGLQAHNKRPELLRVCGVSPERHGIVRFARNSFAPCGFRCFGEADAIVRRLRALFYD